MDSLCCEILGVHLDVTILQTLKDVALPMLDEDPSQIGIVVATAQDIIISMSDVSMEDKVAFNISSHVASQYLEGIWPPFSVDQDDNATNPIIVIEKQDEEFNDAQRLAKQVENDRLMAIKLDQENASSGINDTNRNGSRPSPVWQSLPENLLEYMACKYQAKELLRNNGLGIYSADFSDTVVEAVFENHPAAKKALSKEQGTEEGLLDVSLMVHMCNCLLWRTMSSSVRPCESALKEQPCYIYNCEKEHYLAQLPCRHWMQPTGCHKLNDGSCPFGHDQMIYLCGEEELRNAFDEAMETSSFAPRAADKEQFGESYEDDYCCNNGRLQQEAFLKTLSEEDAAIFVDTFHKDTKDFAGQIFFDHNQLSEDLFPPLLPLVGASIKGDQLAYNVVVGGEEEDSHINQLKTAFNYDHLSSDNVFRVVDHSNQKDGTNATSSAFAEKSRICHINKMKNARSKASRGNNAFVYDPTWAKPIDQAEYKRLREQGVKLAIERNRLFQESQESFRRGDKVLAGRLAKQANEKDKEYKAEVIRAATSIFYLANRNPSMLNNGIVDLHGLHPIEAEIMLKILFYSEEGKLKVWAAHDATDRVKLITGAGRHSRGQVSKLLPVVKDFLKQESAGIGASSVVLPFEEFLDPQGFPAGVIVDVGGLLNSR